MVRHLWATFLALISLSSSGWLSPEVCHPRAGCGSPLPIPLNWHRFCHPAPRNASRFSAVRSVRGVHPSPSPSCRGPQPASGLLLAIPLALAVPLVALARRLLSPPYTEAAWCVCVCLCGCVSVRVYVRTRVYKEFEHLPLAEILSGFGDALIPTLVRVPSPILIQTGKKMGIGVQNVWSL